MEICGRDGRMLAARVEQKNGITKDDKNGVIPLTKKAPYKPDARIGPVRICAGGTQQWASLPRSRVERPVAGALANTNFAVSFGASADVDGRRRRPRGRQHCAIGGIVAAETLAHARDRVQFKCQCHATQASQFEPGSCRAHYCAQERERCRRGGLPQSR
jgi:hypothetical protein